MPYIRFKAVISLMYVCECMYVRMYVCLQSPKKREDWGHVKLYVTFLGHQFIFLMKNTKNKGKIFNKIYFFE